jgi:hypothetical protein
MSAQDKQTGAPSGAPADLALSLIGEFDADKWARAFVQIAPPNDVDTMRGWFACAIMAGYDHKAKEVRAELDKIRAEIEQEASDYRRLVRELDVALNGEAGAAQQASLCDLVAQVRRQQSVQILHLNSGFRINFRAPSGRRGTLRLDTLLDALGEDSEIFEPGIADVARAAMDAYPVAGEPLPLDVDQQTAAQVQALGHQIHPDMARPSVRYEEPGE